MLLCLAPTLPALGQSSEGRDRLVELATIEVTHELCGFDLSDAQEDAITADRRTIVDDGVASGDDVTEIHDVIAAAMARQVPEGLCKSGGPGERLYRQTLGTLGAP